MSKNNPHPLARILPSKPVGPMRVPARALGWFSIGLGAVELLFPRALAHAAGMPNVPLLTRAYGLREIGVGIGLLTATDPQPWLKARAAGDALDIATVGAGFVANDRPLRTLTTLAVLGGVAWVDLQCAEGAAPERSSRATVDYSGRSGFPKPPAEMRGIAARS